MIEERLLPQDRELGAVADQRTDRALATLHSTAHRSASPLPAEVVGARQPASASEVNLAVGAVGGYHHVTLQGDGAWGGGEAHRPGDALIVFDGDQDDLDPEWTSGLIGRISDKLIAADIQEFPCPSFIKKSEW